MTPPTAAERRDWLRLTRTENVGPITFLQLLRRFGTPGEALKALPELAARGGLRRKLQVPALSTIDEELAAVAKAGAELLTLADPAYPRLLATIADPPPVLTVLGHAHLLNKPCVALVGSRNASLNGVRLAERLAAELGQAGFVVVSGLAAGIDGAAHRGALATGTVAVVAGGVDVIYPPAHEKLYHEIATQGCLVAEMPMGFGIKQTLFPRRNRITSGLAQGVVVLDASMKSGALITARMASEQGREVMAVPGSPLDPRASGPNHLIREGATLVQGAADVIEALRRPLAEEGKTPDYSYQHIDNLEEKEIQQAVEKIVNTLSPTPQPIDEVVRLCETPAPVTAAALLELELAGRVVRLPGNLVALVGALDLAAAD